MNAIVQALMRGRASKWLDYLKRLGTAPAMFTEFCTKFLEQCSVLDNSGPLAVYCSGTMLAPVAR